MTARTLVKQEKIAFARDLRAARVIAALQDAERFDELLFALERLGSYLTRTQRDLGQYEEHIRKIAVTSALAERAARTFCEGWTDRSWQNCPMH